MNSHQEATWEQERAVADAELTKIDELPIGERFVAIYAAEKSGIRIAAAMGRRIEKYWRDENRRPAVEELFYWRDKSSDDASLAVHARKVAP